MVCKEEVLLWFKDLEGYKRIDVLYELLNMCVPFELRFLGSCIEEIGKHSYQELRGPAINANDLERLSKDAAFSQNLLDETVRHRVLIYLSLISSRNYSVANWLYRNVLRTDWLDEAAVKGNLKDENVQSEFLLLFVMALYHPAFTFEQKLYFSSILTQIIELRGETRKRSSPKPSGYGYPPGFGYPTIKNMNTHEVPLIPVKATISIPCGDDVLHQPQSACLPPPQEFVAWSIPGYPCGAPEVPAPFPMASVSPLVSESTSPDHSRSASPHRIVTLRSAPMPPSPRQTENTMHTTTVQLPLDPLSSNNFPFLHPTENVKVADDDLNSTPEDKPSEVSWMGAGQPKEAAVAAAAKQPNGIRFGACPPKISPRPFVEQFQALSVDGGSAATNSNETSHLHHHLHHQQQHQRSNSSSGSSPNQTPPETPPAPKPRLNGMPSFVCDTTSPPPPPPTPQTFNSCTVPYTTYNMAPFTAIATRSMFPPYTTQSYRPPFTHYTSYHQTGGENSSFPTYSLPLMPIIYSSQFPHRNANCFNCGGLGHSGQDCTGQNIEDITQKNTFTIEFAPPPLPDPDK